jgi:hypothetical protein
MQRGQNGMLQPPAPLGSTHKSASSNSTYPTARTMAYPLALKKIEKLACRPRWIKRRIQNKREFFLLISLHIPNNSVICGRKKWAQTHPQSYVYRALLRDIRWSIRRRRAREKSLQWSLIFLKVCVVSVPIMEEGRLSDLRRSIDRVARIRFSTLHFIRDEEWTWKQV